MINYCRNRENYINKILPIHSLPSSAPKATYQARVYIWDTNWDDSRCGHSSMTLAKTDTVGGETINHLGFWPQNQGMANPFTLPFPLTSKYVGDVDTDRDHEGDVDLDGEVTPLDPDRVIEIELSPEQYQAMDTAMYLEKNKIDEGKVSYSLFARFNFLSVAKLASKSSFYHDLSRDPICGDTMDNDKFVDSIERIRDLELENCSTEVGKILKAGGIEVQESLTPWGTSPIELGNFLERLSK